MIPAIFICFSQKLGEISIPHKLGFSEISPPQLISSVWQNYKIKNKILLFHPHIAVNYFIISLSSGLHSRYQSVDRFGQRRESISDADQNDEGSGNENELRTHVKNSDNAVLHDVIRG